MTANTTKRSDWDIELPEPLDQLDDEIGEEENRLDRLQSLGNQIEPVYGEAKRLNQEGRKIVAEEIPEVRHDLSGSRTIDELEEIAERIVNIVADPYRQAVRQARNDVCETLGLDGEFDDSTIEQLNELLEDRSTDQLRSDRDILASTETRLDQLGDEAKDVIADTICKEPIRFLDSPEKALKPLVNQHADQHDALEQLDDELKEIGWCPDISLVEIESMYPKDGTTAEVETITDYVSNIDGVIESMPDELPLAAVIQTRLNTVLPESEPETLSRTFEVISERVTDCNDHRTEFQLAVRLVDDQEDHSSYLREVARLIEDLRDSTDDNGILSHDTPVESFADSLEELSGKYGQWANHYRNVLHRDTVAIEAIQSHIEAPTFQPGNTSLTITDGSPDTDEIHDNPLKAVRAHDDYREWVKALKNEGTGNDSRNGHSSVDLLIDLVRGKNVVSNDVDPDDFEVLAGLLEDGLVLQYAGSSSPEAK